MSQLSIPKADSSPIKTDNVAVAGATCVGGHTPTPTEAVYENNQWVLS
jgi:hypothetical protein